MIIWSKDLGDLATKAYPLSLGARSLIQEGANLSIGGIFVQQQGIPRYFKFFPCVSNIYFHAIQMMKNYSLIAQSKLDIRMYRIRTSHQSFSLRIFHSRIEISQVSATKPFVGLGLTQGLSWLFQQNLANTTTFNTYIVGMHCKCSLTRDIWRNHKDIIDSNRRVWLIIEVPFMTHSVL